MSDTPDTDIDTCAIFRVLRDRWLAMEPGRSAEDLAVALEQGLERSVARARISVWATGSERKAPWDVIRWLQRETGMTLVIPDKGDPYFTSNTAEA